jgi:hypothetical protein
VFITRTTVACVFACGLLAITAATAAAAPSPEERYLNSYGSPPAADVSTAAAQTQEQYYSSYGTPASRQEPSGEAPWLPIALVSLAIVVAAGAVGATRRRRRPHPVRSVPA